MGLFYGGGRVDGLYHGLRFVFCFYFSCIGLAREYALGSVFLSLFRVWIDRALIMKQGNQGLDYL